MSKPEFELAPGITEVTDFDAWALPLLEEEAAYTRDQEVIELAGKLGLRLKYGLDLDEDQDDNKH